MTEWAGWIIAGVLLLWIVGLIVEFSGMRW